VWLFLLKKDMSHHRDENLRGLSEVAQLGVPGGVVAYGPNTFVIFTNHADPEPIAIAAGVEFGTGRAILLAHDGYLDQHFSPFIQNCIKWARG